jgi:hypothetical protein
MNWDSAILMITIVLAVPGLILLVCDMGSAVSYLQISLHDYFSPTKRHK